MNESLFKYWVILAGLLFLKMLCNSLIQIYIRIRHKQYAGCEDEKLFGRFSLPPSKLAKTEHPLLSRASRCWQNDLENIPMFLVLSLGFVLAGGDTTWGVIYFSVFLLSRILHTVFYMTSIQPGRGMAWDIGLLATLAVTGHSIYTVW